jgi:putative Holliday junction resolvase
MMTDENQPPITQPAAAPAPLTREDAVAMTLLGVDWGRRRIGLAIKPAGQDWSLPQATLHTPNEKIALDGLRQAVERAGAGGVVVGLPLHPNPEQVREIRRFTRKAREGMRGVRWFFIDEAFTTQAADDLSHQDPTRGRRPTDDLAATLILQQFIGQCR